MILKICGVTSQEDADAAVAAGANALGFNFYPHSPRFIAPERAAAIATPAGVLRVGIFVNESPAHVEALARAAALDVAQLHGSEQPAEYPAGVRVWKAIRVTKGFDLAPYAGCPAEALLLDGPASGQAFDWRIAEQVGDLPRLILAGGLDAANVAQAVALVHPWGVDACSRIESAPGKKDHKKMTAFLAAAREALGA
jgi:phosphoribosylanthranilate isomerase